jgi:hypothetical protein
MDVSVGRASETSRAAAQVRSPHASESLLFAERLERTASSANRVSEKTVHLREEMDVSAAVIHRRKLVGVAGVLPFYSSQILRRKPVIQVAVSTLVLVPARPNLAPGAPGKLEARPLVTRA